MDASHPLMAAPTSRSHSQLYMALAVCMGVTVGLTGASLAQAPATQAYAVPSTATATQSVAGSYAPLPSRRSIAQPQAPTPSMASQRGYYPSESMAQTSAAGATVTSSLRASAGAVFLGASALLAVAAHFLRRQPAPQQPSPMAMFPVTGTMVRPRQPLATPSFSANPSSLLNGGRAPAFGARTNQTARKSMALNASLKTGIVGLPNVGKSTLFNALTGGATAEAANYPFCTIEPNVGIVQVPDRRLQVLSELSKSVKTIPATLEFVDIAGIVKGASKGEGMGNKFLSNIRECDSIVHVVRCFDDENVIHVDGVVNPVNDMEVINLELIFSDLEQAEKRMAKVEKDKKPDPVEKAALEKLLPVLTEGRPARAAGLTDEEKFAIKSMGLLTLKEMIYAANVPEDDLLEGNDLSKSLQAQATEEGARVILMSAQLEAELVELDKEERVEMLESLGVDEENCGLKALVRESYSALGLQTYFTTGQTETRAWTIKKGFTAPQAAGVIHGDFERGFIRAETMAYGDLVELGSEKNAKEAGKLRAEGKDYVVNEGDVMHFLFNV